MDWWTRDPFFTSQGRESELDSSGEQRRGERARLEAENHDLRKRLEALERLVASPEARAVADKQGDA